MSRYADAMSASSAPEPHVFLTRALDETLVREFAPSLGHSLRAHPSATEPPTSEDMAQQVRGAAGLITMVTDRIDADALDAAGPQLQVVANMGVGYDNIDCDAAAQRGVTVTNTPGVLDEAVADLTLALILTTARRLAEGDRFIRTGTPWIWGPQDFVGMDLSAGRTLGIVGLGRIGMAVARRAAAFGVRIRATGSGAHSEEARSLGVEPATFEQLLPEADVLSLHCPLTPETRHLIGAAELAAMKPGSLLINTGRGPLVDEEALADALESGHLGGAGLDVHEHEPTVNDRLRALENTVLLPHIGSAGDETRRQMATLAFRNAAAVLRGEKPPHPVT